MGSSESSSGSSTEVSSDVSCDPVNDTELSEPSVDDSLPPSIGQSPDSSADLSDDTELTARTVDDAEIPRTVGRYEIDSVLGYGGMGIVYAARDPNLDRRVALKVLRGHDNDVARERLIREARAMAKLHHPAVVTVHDVGIADGIVYVAMELINGTTIGDWIKRDSPSAAQILDAYVSAGRGLAAAHAAGLVHRDFKPQNVLRSREGRFLVTDFGLAREASTRAPQQAKRRRAHAKTDRLEHKPPREQVGQHLTETGTIVGTPGYMAPEQHDGNVAGPPADQFAFCVALWLALTGSRPFSGETLVEIRVQIELGPDPESEARLPAGVRSILRRGLAVDPALRWPNMTALLDAMDATARAPTVRTRPRRWPRARWLLAAGAGVLAAGGATIAAITSTSSGRASTLRSIEADAERIGPALDATARATELRAESIATAPMLRIAIETDRTTISDVVRTEMKMTARSGETLEIVNDKPISALRMPDDGKPLQVTLERSIVLGSTGSELFVQVSEPIAGTKRRVAGALAIVEPVDLTVVRRMLAEHASEATLVGPQLETVIVPAAGPRSSTPVRLAVRGSHHWDANLALLVVPRESPTRSWTRPTQLAGVAFAAVMLVLGLLRRR